MVADRILILCPAPLTVQSQHELHDKFDENLKLIDSHQIKWQLGQSSMARVRPVRRLDPFRQARRGAARSPARRLGPGDYRRGTQRVRPPRATTRTEVRE